MKKEDWARAMSPLSAFLFKWQNHFTRKFIICHGAISRKGVRDGNTVGDSATEARDRHMSVEVTSASTEYGGIASRFSTALARWSLPKKPTTPMGVDAAVVVCEPTSDASDG